MLKLLSILFLVTLMGFSQAETNVQAIQVGGKPPTARPMRTIEYYGSEPYTLRTFGKNACHRVSLHMKVSCVCSETDPRSDGTMSEMGQLSIGYGDKTEHVRRLWRHYNTIDHGKMVANNVVNMIISVNNSTEYLPKLLFTKGSSCDGSSVTMDIYELDTLKVVCHSLNDEIHRNTLTTLIIMFCLLMIYMLLFHENQK